MPKIKIEEPRGSIHAFHPVNETLSYDSFMQDGPLYQILCTPYPHVVLIV